MARSNRTHEHAPIHRRHFLAAGTGSVAGIAAMSVHAAQSDPGEGPAVVRPPEGRRILLSCKLGMIPKELDGKALSLVERLRMAGQAGFDGVDFDQAGEWSPEQARDAVRDSGVFVHNAINHAHWSKRLTSADEAERAEGRANIEHHSSSPRGRRFGGYVSRGSDGRRKRQHTVKAEIRTLRCRLAGPDDSLENAGTRCTTCRRPSDKRADQFIERSTAQQPPVAIYDRHT